MKPRRATNPPKPKRAPLTLDVQRSEEDDSYMAPNTIAELSVEHHGRHAVRLSCLVVSRDRAIADGEPVLVRFELPDYELVAPFEGQTTLPVQLHDAEELLEAMLETVREAKRLGFAGPERTKASA